MKRLLILLAILAPAIVAGQQTVRFKNVKIDSNLILSSMPTDTSKLILVLGADGKVRANRSAGGTGATTDSLAWYRNAGAAWQRGASDSVVINRKITAKGSDLWMYSRSPTTPATSNAEVYLSGTSGSMYIKAMKHNPPFSNAYAMYTLSPANAASGWNFSTDEFGTYAYQLDEYGFYPTDYTTAGDYNQYIGTPANKWRRGYFERLIADTIPSGALYPPLASSQWTTETDGIYYNGKVGIGTTNPLATDSTVQVTGSINATRGAKFGYDISVNGLTVGRGKKGISTNTAVGYEANNSITTGSYNTGIGAYSIRSTTTGVNNTALGGQSMYTNSGGDRNTAVGMQSLYGNTNGKNNTSVGFTTMSSNTTGFSNTAVGVSALYSNTTKSNLVAIGDSALYWNGTGIRNTGVGSKALYSNSTGSNNTAIGYEALKGSTGTGSNTAIGKNALKATDIGISNVAVGAGAGEYNTTGSQNTIIGQAAASLGTLLLRHTAVGYLALYNTNSGSICNTAIGHSALLGNTSGDWNIALGDSAGYAYTTLSNRMYLGARDTVGTTGGIYFDRTPAKRWGKWMGTLKVTNIPADGSPDSVLTVVDGLIKRAAFPTGGSGTVTSISQGTGMLNSADPITTTGTIGVDTSKVVMFTDTSATGGKIATSYALTTGLAGKQAAGSYVTSVGATSPVASSGGTTPTVSINTDTLTSWYTKQNQGATAYGWGDHSKMSYVVGFNNNKKIVLFGNSIIKLGLFTAEGRAYESARGFYNWGNAYLNFPFDDPIMKGVGGSTTTNMLSRFRQDVANYSPGYCLIEGGVNDNDSAVVLFSNLRRLYDSCIINHIRPIATTVTPSHGTPGFTEATNRQYIKLNQLIRDYCNDNNIPCVDFAKEVVRSDTASFRWKPGYSTDSLHPNLVGAAAMGKAYFNALRSIVAPSDRLPKVVGEVNILTKNCMMTGSAGTNETVGTVSGDIATSFKVNSTSTAVMSKVARSYGDWQKIVISSSGALDLHCDSITSGFSVGDTVCALAEVKVDGAFTLFNGIQLTIYFYNGSTRLWEQTFNQMPSPANYLQVIQPEWMLKTSNVIIPATTNKIIVKTTIKAESGTFYIGRLCLRKIVEISTNKSVSEVYGVPLYNTKNTETGLLVDGDIKAAKLYADGGNSDLWNTIADMNSSQWLSNGTKVYYSEGNVGIGTSVPSSLLSVVSLKSSSHPFFIKNSIGGGSGADTSIVFTSNGTLGININEPLTTLHVYSNYSPTAYFDSYNGNPIVRFRRINAIGSPNVKLNDNIGAISSTGHNGTSLITASRAMIRMFAGENWTSSANGSGIDFITTANGGTSSTVKATITPSGYFGLGTTSPSALLDVAGAAKIQSLQVGSYNVSVTDNVSIPQTASTVGLGNLTNKAQVELEDSVSGAGSYATQYDISLLATKASPTITGTMTVPELKYAASPGTDHTVSGDIISLTAATTQAIGDVIYIASTGKATLCDADAIATCPYALAVCADASISADAAGDYMTKGVIRDDTWNWTVGGLIYVAAPGGSAASGSTLTQTAPSGSNNVIIPVGVALSADIMYFWGNLNTVEKQ